MILARYVNQLNEVIRTNMDLQTQEEEKGIFARYARGGQC